MTPSAENPYAPPQVSPDNPSALAAAAPLLPLQDPRALGWVAIVLINAASLLSIVIELFSNRVDRGLVDDLQGGAAGLFLLAGLAVILAFLGSVIVYLMWLFRCAKNATLLLGKELQTKPGMAVACYFIPFYNLVAPFFSMKEIVEVTYRHTHRDPAAGFIIPWWLLWIGSGIANPIFANSQEWFWIPSVVLDFAGIVLSIIIFRLSKVQATLEVAAPQPRQPQLRQAPNAGAIPGPRPVARPAGTPPPPSARPPTPPPPAV